MIQTIDLDDLDDRSAAEEMDARYARVRAASGLAARAAKLPALAVLGFAAGSIALSAGLHLTGKQRLAFLVALWAPSLLAAGLSARHLARRR